MGIEQAEQKLIIVWSGRIKEVTAVHKRHREEREGADQVRKREVCELFKGD